MKYQQDKFKYYRDVDAWANSGSPGGKKKKKKKHKVLIIILVIILIVAIGIGTWFGYKVYSNGDGEFNMKGKYL